MIKVFVREKVNVNVMGVNGDLGPFMKDESFIWSFIPFVGLTLARKYLGFFSSSLVAFKQEICVNFTLLISAYRGESVGS